MIHQLKEDIRVLATEQIELRNQRKTVRRKGEKKMTPYEAFCKHQSNRRQLRHMYIIYGELRGKTLDQIEQSRKTEPSEYLLDKLRKQYQPIMAD